MEGDFLCVRMEIPLHITPSTMNERNVSLRRRIFFFRFIKNLQMFCMHTMIIHFQNFTEKKESGNKSPNPKCINFFSCTHFFLPFTQYFNGKMISGMLNIYLPHSLLSSFIFFLVASRLFLHLSRAMKSETNFCVFFFVCLFLPSHFVFTHLIFIYTAAAIYTYRVFMAESTRALKNVCWDSILNGLDGTCSRNEIERKKLGHGDSRREKVSLAAWNSIKRPKCGYCRETNSNIK